MERRIGGKFRPVIVDLSFENDNGKEARYHTLPFVILEGKQRALPHTVTDTIGHGAIVEHAKHSRTKAVGARLSGLKQLGRPLGPFLVAMAGYHRKRESKSHGRTQNSRRATR